MKKLTSSDSNADGKRPAGPSVEQLTEQNVETVTRLEEAARDQRAPSDRLAEKIARFCGSMTFVWVHVVWFGGWILLNSIPGIRHVDPFPFTFLTLIVSLEAIFLSTFILISQNLDSRIVKDAATGPATKPAERTGKHKDDRHVARHRRQSGC